MSAWPTARHHTPELGVLDRLWAPWYDVTACVGDEKRLPDLADRRCGAAAARVSSPLPGAGSRRRRRFAARRHLALRQPLRRLTGEQHPLDPPPAPLLGLVGEVARARPCVHLSPAHLHRYSPGARALAPWRRSRRAWGPAPGPKDAPCRGATRTPPACSARCRVRRGVAQAGGAAGLPAARPLSAGMR